MKEFALKESPHIDLCDLLKIAGFAPSSGVGKHFVAEGKVTVDGVIELRKRAKIRSGQIVDYQGQKIKVV